VQAISPDEKKNTLPTVLKDSIRGGESDESLQTGFDSRSELYAAWS
jgi:hypothetical protein